MSGRPFCRTTGRAWASWRMVPSSKEMLAIALPVAGEGDGVLNLLGLTEGGAGVRTRRSDAAGEQAVRTRAMIAS